MAVGGNFNTPLLGVTQIIVFTLPWLNSYCPYASLRGNWHPRPHFLSTT